MRLLLLVLLVISSTPSFAFVLISPSYHLSNPSDTKVNIASGACRGNGIPDAELFAAIQTTIDWWNEVPGSMLILKMGSEVSRTTTDTPIAGEILVGCRPLGNANGITFNDEDNGSASISLNANTLVPGGYNPGAIESTLVHEMGHALGLHHSDDPASVMTYRTTEWFLPSSLPEDDKDGIRYLYPMDPNLIIFGGCTALASDTRNISNFRKPFAGLAGDFFFIFLVWFLIFGFRKIILPK